MTKRSPTPPATVQAQTADLLGTACARVDEAVAGVRDALASIQAELGQRREDLRAARAVPATRAEAVEHVGRIVEALAYGVRLPEAFRFERPAEAVAHLAEIPAAKLLAAVAPDLLAAGMLAPLDTASAERGGWGETPPEARAAAIAEAEVRVLELESAEARAIAAARRAGIDLADFPPRPQPPRPPGTYNFAGERVG